MTTRAKVSTWRVAGALAMGALVVVPLSSAHTNAVVTPHALTCTNASAVASWTLGQLANETVAVPANATDLSTISASASEGFAGVLVFGNSAPKNFATQVASLRARVPRHGGYLVMTDDEGGGVWRLANLVAPLPWAKSLAHDSPTQITTLVHRAVVAMAHVGVSMDLAPVLDVDGSNVVPGAANADGLRSFSGTTSMVTKDGLAYLKGFSGTSVVAVVKHFPGLGGVSPNTDVGSAATKPWSYVQAHTLAPFVAAINAGARAVMVANVTVPGLTTRPASLSPAVMNVLRHQLGFNGLIMTDSLSAGAISQAHYGVISASVAALAAGANLVLFSIPVHHSTMALARQISSSIVKAVGLGTIHRSQLEADAVAVASAQHANLCT